MTRVTKKDLEQLNALLNEENIRLRRQYDSMRKRYFEHAKIIAQIPRAKRQAGFPLKSVFFRDVWPVVLEAYLENVARYRGKKKPCQDLAQGQ